jgi:hypothetical protein
LEARTFDLRNKGGDSSIEWEPTFEFPPREDTTGPRNAICRDKEFVFPTFFEEEIGECAFEEHCVHQEQQHVNMSARESSMVEELSTPLNSCLRKTALLEHACSTITIAAIAVAEADDDEQCSSNLALDPVVLLATTENITIRITVPKPQLRSSYGSWLVVLSFL